jgi:ferredoxin
MPNLNQTARTAALNVRDSYQLKSTSLISYQSRGTLLVLGDLPALNLCAGLLAPLSVTAILNAEKAPKLPFPVIALKNRRIEIHGHLGAFTVALVNKSSDEREIYRADMILDTNPEALLSTQLLPAGYVHSVIDEQKFASVQQQLLDMVGEFEKPRYFQYDPSICAHGTNGMTVCTNCIDACPADAISSLIETIEVDPYLCLGGGACASACPSGAIQYAYPQLKDSGNRIRKMLQAYRETETETEDAIIVFHTESTLNADVVEKYPSILPIQVEEIASVGMDLCLSSLAYGAAQVVLIADEEVPVSSLQNLHMQIEWMHALLAGLNLDPQKVCVVSQMEEFQPLEDSSALEPALYTMPENKRTAIFQALDHLYQQIEKTREVIDLPAGAPFGSVEIDENACTLCMACVGACPGKALQDGSNREIPEVFFIESNCIQCDTCTQTCPEDAISISPRMILDREKRSQSRVLHQDIPFACISCGKPFAPTSVINKMNDSLKDHYMFKTPRALDRLKMCEDCRVADIVQDPEALNGNFDPLNEKKLNHLP